MPGSDGAVVIDVKLTASDAEKELGRLKREILKLEESLSFKNAKMDGLTQKLETARAELAEMESQVQYIAERGGKAPKVLFPNGYHELKATIADMETEQSKLTAEIEQTNEKLAATKRRYGEVAEQAKALPPEAKALPPEAKALPPEAKKTESLLDRVEKRLGKLAARVFFFSVVTAGLRELKNWFADVIKTDKDAVGAIAQLKGALLTLVQPLVSVVIPAFTTFVQVLTQVVSAIASVVASLMGTTAEESATAAKELYDEQKALDAVGGSAKKASKQLAAFDEINKLSEDTGGESSIKAITPDFTTVTNPIGILKDLSTDLAIKIQELKFDFNRGKLGKNKHAWITMLTSLFGAVIGSIFGGSSGAVIGLLLGASIGLVTCSFLDKLENPDSAKNTFIVVMSAILGAVLGTAYGGFGLGTGIGLLLGAGIGIIAVKFMDKTENADAANALFYVVLGSIMGAVLGSVFAGFGVGTTIGLMLGADITIIGLEFKKGESSTWDPNDTVVVVLAAILGAILGTVFGGFGLGTGIGLLLGATIAFAAISFTEGKYNKQEAVAALRTTLFAILGAVIGVMFGGLVGGAIGLTMGLAIGFASVAFDENLEASMRNMASKALQVALYTIIGALVGAVFGAGVFGGIVGGVIGLTMGLAVTLDDANIFNKTAVKTKASAAEIHSGVTTRGVFTQSVRGVSVSQADIPQLARGAVIPPNREFMAVLGDQSNGTNLEAPEELIRQIVREESGGNYLSILQQILDAVREGKVLMVDRSVLAQVVGEAMDSEDYRRGSPMITLR